MRHGYRIYDADTHVHAMAESLDPYLGPELRARVPDLDRSRAPFRIGWAGEKLEEPFRHTFRFTQREGLLGRPPGAGPRFPGHSR